MPKETVGDTQIEILLKDHKEDHLNNAAETNYSVSSGSLGLDIVLDGGLKPGIARFAGASEAGKTSATLAFMKNFLSGKNRRGIYIKAEGRLSNDVQERSGVKFVSDPKTFADGECFVLKSNIYEFVMTFIRELINNNKDSKSYFFIIDSMDALVAKNDAAKSFEETNMTASSARLTSDFLRKMSLSIGSFGHIAVLISQVRANIQISQYVKADPKLVGASGGNALNHYPDVVLEFESRNNSTDIIFEGAKKDKRIGHFCKVVVRKSPNEKTGTKITYPIKYGRIGGNSVWVEHEIAELLIGWELIKKSASWLMPSEPLIKVLKENSFEIPEKIQGLDNLRELLESNTKLTKFLYDYISQTLK